MRGEVGGKRLFCMLVSMQFLGFTFYGDFWKKLDRLIKTARPFFSCLNRGHIHIIFVIEWAVSKFHFIDLF